MVTVPESMAKNVKGLSGMFSQQNAGKRNICLDLRAPGAIGLVKDLVAVADIVIENYRPGVMDRLGIDYAVLSGRTQSLSCCQFRVLVMIALSHIDPLTRRWSMLRWV